MSTRKVTYAPLVAAVDHGVVSLTRASNIEKSYPADRDHDTLPGKALAVFLRHDTPTLPILNAINELWREIQHTHPGTPPVNIVLQADTRAHGHFAPNRYEGAAHHELMLSTLSMVGEWNTNGGQVIKTVSTLLHEAAHAYAHAKGIQDTSRSGRYHNKRFANLAASFGCVVERDPNTNVNQNIGHVTPGITDSARALYADKIENLMSAITIYRRISSTNPYGGTTGIDLNIPFTPKPRKAYGSATVTVSCPCDTIYRIPRDMYEKSTMTCDNCGEAYSI